MNKLDKQCLIEFREHLLKMCDNSLEHFLSAKDDENKKGWVEWSKVYSYFATQVTEEIKYLEENRGG